MGLESLLLLKSPQIVVGADIERGCDIRLICLPSGRNLLASYDWSTPVPATASQTYGSSWLDWLSHYRGGWQELFPNSGQDSLLGPVPLPFHGEVSTLRWEVISAGGTTLHARSGSRLPLVLDRCMEVDDDRPIVRLRERALNVANEAVHFVWGHHPAFAAVSRTLIDLPSASAVVGNEDMGPTADLPPGAEARWPLFPARDGSIVDASRMSEQPTSRLIYLPSIGEGWAAVRWPDEEIGIALSWDVSTFPHLWLWQERGSTGYPFYGRAALVAIEPQSAWPADGLDGAVERGQALRLEPGQTRETVLLARIIRADQRRVTGVAPDGTVSLEGFTGRSLPPGEGSASSGGPVPSKI